MAGTGWTQTTMGRGTRLRSNDYNSATTATIRVKDDRRRAEQITTEKDFDALLERDGAVAKAIENENSEDYQDSIVRYRADGVRTVDNKNVKKAVTSLREEIINARFEPKARIDKLREEEKLTNASGKPLTVREKENLENREYQIRAIGLLTAIRVGKVKISSYDKGILNRLAKGKHQEVVYGKQNSRGGRQFEKGTFKNKLGFRQGKARSNTAEGQAIAKEKADTLREANQGERVGGKNIYKGNGYYNSIKKAS